MDYQKYTIREEVGNQGSRLFYYDVTEYIKDVMGSDVVREAELYIGYFEKFDKMKPHKQEEVRKQMYEKAKYIDENFEKNKENESYECFSLYVVFKNGKEFSFNSMGSYWHLTTEN